MNIKDLEKNLDTVAKDLEKKLQKLIPGADFRFTHQDYWIYKRTIEIKESVLFPILHYYPIKDLSEITPKSRLLIVASVKVFGRKQTVQVRCITHKKRGKIGLKCEPDKPVDIIDVDYFSEEETEKIKNGKVVFPVWVKDYQELIGALTVVATEIALRLLGL